MVSKTVRSLAFTFMAYHAACYLCAMTGSLCQVEGGHAAASKMNGFDTI
jgi:hypothetical protein